MLAERAHQTNCIFRKAVLVHARSRRSIQPRPEEIQASLEGVCRCSPSPPGKRARPGRSIAKQSVGGEGGNNRPGVGRVSLGKAHVSACAGWEGEKKDSAATLRASIASRCRRPSTILEKGKTSKAWKDDPNEPSNSASRARSRAHVWIGVGELHELRELRVKAFRFFPKRRVPDARIK